MRSFCRVMFWLIVGTEALLALGIGFGGCYIQDSRRTRAVEDHRQKPGAETQAILDATLPVSILQKLMSSVIAFSVMAGVTVLPVWLLRVTVGPAPTLAGPPSSSAMSSPCV